MPLPSFQSEHVRESQVRFRWMAAGRDSESRIVLSLFGSVRVEANGVASDPPGDATRSLLAVLGHRIGQFVTIGALQDALWADEPPPSASASLRNHLTRMRRYLAGVLDGPSIERAGEQVRLSHPLLTTDVDIARTLLAEAQAKLLTDPSQAADLAEQAAQRTVGEAGAGIGDTPVLNDIRHSLAALQDDAKAWRIRCLVAAGKGRQILAELRAATSRRPYDEEAAGLLAVSLYESGQAADAISALQHCRRSLAEDLGVEPSSALTDIERAVLQHDEEALRKQTNRRPAEGVVDVHISEEPLVPVRLQADNSTVLAGRKDERRIARDFLDNSRLGRSEAPLYIVGSAGEGKTRLLADIAESAQAQGMYCFHTWAESDDSLRLGPHERLSANAWPDKVRGAAADFALVVAASTSRSDVGQSVAWRLERTVGHLMSELAERSIPSLFLLDDLQWFDENGAGILRQAVRHTGTTVSAIVATRHMIDDVDAITLGPLSTADVAHIVEAGEIQIDAGTIAHIARLTAGNAQAVHSVLRSYGSRGPTVEAVPTGIAETVRSRLRQLSGEEVKFLYGAAIVGFQFDVAVVNEVCETEIGASQLARLDEVGLVRRRGTESCFQHELMREAVLVTVPGPAAVDIHSRAVAHLRSIGAEPHVVAKHAIAAVPRIPSAEAAVLALGGGEHIEVSSPRQASDLYKQAEQLSLSDSTDMVLTEAKAIAGRGRTAIALGEREEGLEDLRRALLTAARAGRHDLVSTIALDVVDQDGAIEITDSVPEILQLALTLSPHSMKTELELICFLVAYLAGSRAIPDELVKRRDELRSALRHEAAELDFAVWRSRLGEVTASANPHELRQVAQDLVQASASSSHPRSSRTWFSGIGAWAAAELRLGNVDTAQALISAFDTEEAARQSPSRVWFANIVRADIAQNRGDLDDAARLADESLTVGQQLGLPDAVGAWSALRALNRWLRRPSPEIAKHASSLGRGDASLRGVTAGFVALVLAETDEGTARDAIDTVIAEALEGPNALTSHFALGMASHACAVVGTAAQARRILDALIPHQRTVIRLAHTGPSMGPTDWLIGRLMLRLREPNATESLEAALDLSRRMQARTWEALCLQELRDAQGLSTSEEDRLQNLVRAIGLSEPRTARGS